MIDLEKLRASSKREASIELSSLTMLELLDHIAQLEKDAGRLKVLLDAQDSDDEECQFAVIKNANYDCYQSSVELIDAIDTATEASNG